MAHFDTTTLSLIALGETPTAEEAVHLVTCDTCRHEWESLRALVVTARDVDEHDLVAPPAHVWGAISAEISADSTNVVPLRARRSASSCFSSLEIFASRLASGDMALLSSASGE